MRKILATFIKEWILLLRDIPGLIILFALPLCLVTFLSLTGSHDVNGSQKYKLLVIDKDKGTVSKAIEKAIAKTDEFNITLVHDKNFTKSSAISAVGSGDYQALFIIPSKTTASVNRYTHKLETRRVSRHEPKQIQLYLDPGMPGGMADSIKLSIQYLLKEIEYKTMTKLLVQNMRIRNTNFNKDLFKVKTKYSTSSEKIIKPNSVQQNVPAWSLFGMFFIVIPIAGTMVRERGQGVIQRLRIAPVSQALLLTGKTIAYLALNLVQLFLMLLVGVYLLPLFGLPHLDLWSNIFNVLILGIATSFAAIGFGIFIGTWVNTYQQAIVVGPFIIVILAAIGGIFVPQYVMPKALTYISNVSPFYWAQSSFLDIFVRGENFTVFLPSIFKLLGFFVLMLFLSLPPFTRFIMHRKVSD